MTGLSQGDDSRLEDTPPVRRTFPQAAAAAGLVLALAAGCGPAAPAPTPGFPPFTPLGATTPTLAAEGGAPEVLLLTPEATTTRAPTQTPVPTRATSFASASVYAVSHLPGSRLMVTIEVPGGVHEAYWALIGLAELDCLMQQAYADRLYCIGPEPFQNSTNVLVSIRVFPIGEVIDVFEEEFLIPPRPAFVVTPGGTATP